MAETISKSVLTPDKPVTLPLLKTKEKKQLGKGTRIALAATLALTGVEGTGAVVSEVTNEQPASVRTIIPDLVWPYTMVKDWLHKETPVPPNFDPDAKEGTIGAGINTITVSEDTRRSMYKQQVAKNKDTGRPTVLFPAIFTASGQRINYKYQEPFSPFSDGTILNFPGRMNTHFDKGIEIPVPAENVDIFQGKPVIIDGNKYFTGTFMTFDQNGETFGFGLGAQDVRTLIPLGDVLNAPEIPTSEKGTELLPTTKNGLKLPMGTAAVKVNIDTNFKLNLAFSKLNKQTGKWDSVEPFFVIYNSTATAKLPMTSIATQ